MSPAAESIVSSTRQWVSQVKRKQVTSVMLLISSVYLVCFPVGTDIQTWPPELCLLQARVLLAHRDNQFTCAEKSSSITPLSLQAREGK